MYRVTWRYGFHKEGDVKGERCRHTFGNSASQKRIGLKRPEDFPEGVYRSFPYDSLLDWNIQEFGPLFVPGEGDVVKMNRTGGVLYRKFIEWEQGKKMNVKGETVAGC